MREKSFSFSKQNSQQPNYQGGEKKVMKKSLSLILALAMVFSMFASVAFAAETTTAPKTAQEQFDVLKAKGIFEGVDAAGNAGLTEKMNRAQVAKILVKLAGLTEDKAGAAGYTDLASQDWAVGFIGAATKAGLMEGPAAGKFDPSATFTTQELATVMVRALGLKVSTDAVEGTVSDWAKGYVAAAVKAGLIVKSADYTAPALREVLVTASFAALTQLDIINGEKNKPSVDVKVTGVKTIVVTFNKAVDTDKATFTVKKGTFETTVDGKPVWNTEKTVATLTVSGNLTKGDYTVTVGGVVEPAFTKTLTVEDQKVAKVEFTSDKAPLVRNSTNTQVTAQIKITNQYGEDVTSSKFGNVTFSVGKGTFAKNADKKSITVTASSNDAFRLDEVLAASALYSDGLSNQVFAQANLKVAAAPQVTKLSVEKLANMSDATKTAKVGNTASTFVMVVKGEDQYGNSANVALLKDDVNVSVSNQSVAGFATATVGNVVYADFQSVTPAGYTDAVTGLYITNSTDAGASNWKAGTTTYYFYSKTTGAQTTFELKVADSAKVDSFTMDQPETAVAGEETVIPFTAVDQYGNAITDFNTLNGIGAGNAFTSFGVSGPAGIAISFKPNASNDGKAKLVLDAKNIGTQTNDTTAYINAYTNTGKYITLNVTIKPQSKPVDIYAVSDVDYAIALGATDHFQTGDISVYDQYGRKKALSDYTTYDASVVSNNTAIAVSAATMKAGSGDVAFTANSSTSASAQITLQLIGPDGVALADSEHKFVIRNVLQSEIADYTVADITKVYADNTMTQGVTVKGTLADGTVVTLPVPATYDTVNKTTYNSYYSVSDGTYIRYTGGNVLTQGAVPFGTATEKTYQLIVTTTNKDKAQKTFTKDVVVSNVAPEAAKLELRSSGIATKESDSVLSVSYTDINTNGATLLANAGVKVTDQYGKEDTSLTKFDNVVVSGYNSSRIIGALAAGDSFSFTAVADGKSVSVKVNVKN